eukprot:CAMPEP_0202347936 /NCGR_PEP_ID=MMETSP1126-20121109/6086_1 /ASSEMBLY_ACC=CAM_ASM_000457 /TAXON_ID=3047 /ORGANISM="Dunaliella tertiolecta, Strain CCMP1320" /LENGTH=145 /DNA_ID=CAMNT_0048939561 /DNA_START=734 /DNA_END=1171 /DNA_ORIENTATION=-
MAQVHHMPYALAARFLDHIHHTRFNGRLASEQDPWVHVTLHSEACADAVDALSNVHTLIQADAIWATRSHALQQASPTTDVQDDGDMGVRGPKAVDDLLCVWCSKDLEVLRHEVRSPAVKDLHHLGAMVGLVSAIVCHVVCQLFE